MHRRPHRLLLLLLTLSVALAPLRVSWALPLEDAADAASHCTGMQHNMQHRQHHADPGDGTDSKPHRCKTGCNGACCNQGCASCLQHATSAIPASNIVLHEAPVDVPDPAVADRFPDRHPKPPLRPPRTLR